MQIKISNVQPGINQVIVIERKNAMKKDKIK